MIDRQHHDFQRRGGMTEHAMPDAAPNIPDLFAIMRTARSMRRLEPDPVPPELIRKILSDFAGWLPHRSGRGVPLSDGVYEGLWGQSYRDL
jgi:hypothetical protein